MTNGEAAKILRVRDEQRMKQLFGPKFAEALTVAIAALESPLLAVDYKRAGLRGAQMQQKRYSSKDFRKWGKLGGRPKTKERKVKDDK